MGFDFEKFIDGQNLDLFKCKLCKKVLENPKVIKQCNHIYCNRCIQKWLKNYQCCPEDKEPISQQDLIEPFLHYKTVYESLKVKCDYEQVKQNFSHKIFTIFRHFQVIYKNFISTSLERLSSNSQS